MNALHITSAYPYPGYEAYGIFIKEQIESLEAFHVRNEVFFINARARGAREYIRRLGPLRGMAESYDLAHAHHPFAAAAYLIARRQRRPWVYSHLGDWTRPPNIQNRLLRRWAASSATRVIIKSDLGGRRLPDKFIYLPNGVDTERFKPMSRDDARARLGLPRNDAILLFVSAAGTSVTNKRYDKFMDVVHVLRQRGWPITPLVMSAVQREETPWYFNASNALVLTSDQEGSPNAVKEAMACNVPVVSTRVGNVARMIEGAAASSIAQGGTVDELASGVIRALDCPDRNERDLIFRAGLDMKSVAGRLVDIYRQVIQQ